MGSQENKDQKPNDVTPASSQIDYLSSSLDQGAKQNGPRPAEKND